MLTIAVPFGLGNRSSSERSDRAGIDIESDASTLALSIRRLIRRKIPADELQKPLAALIQA